MMATDSSGGSSLPPSSPAATIASRAAAWNCMPRPATSCWKVSSTVFDESITRNVVGLYQTGSISIRASVPITTAVVGRGRERFNIYCSPCHGVAGDGDGMIVKRGYKRPTSYHDPRLRNERAGYFFDVMTRGFGQMPDYAAQVSPKDRWAIVAYIRALQLSQHASVGDLTPEEKARLERGETTAPESSGHAPADTGHEGAPQHE